MIQWLDIASAVTAQTHSGRICVTASVDSVRFKRPAHVGDIIRIEAKVTRSFSTSMEVKAAAWARKVLSKEEYLVNEAYFTFVALDDFGKPAEIPAIKPVSSTEKREYAAALKRRKQRI
jgi:acyl-CoA hydrolase